MKILNTCAKTLSLSFALMFAVSCSDHNEEHEKVDTLKLLINSNSILDPSVNDQYPSTQAVGLFSLNKELERTTLLDNQKAIYNGSKWYLDKNRTVILREDSIDVYAYCPYDPNMQSDEWLRIQSGTIDYMYGFHDLAEYGYINYAHPYAHIKMQHAMAMLKLDIRPLLEQMGQIDHIYIEGSDPEHPIYSTGQINMFTDETGSLHVLDGEVECFVDKTGTKAVIYMIPCKGATVNISVVVNGKKHSLTVYNLDFEPGMVRNYWLEFDVRKEKLYVKDFNIEPWIDGKEIDLETDYK